MSDNLATERLNAGMATARRLYFVAVVLFAVVYLGSGITVVGPGEAAVVLRFGELHRVDGEAIVHPSGLLLAWPQPIDRVIRLPLKQEQLVEIDHFWPTVEAESPENVNRVNYALTGDRNLVRMRVLAKYRIAHPEAFVVACHDPRELIAACVTSGVTAVVQECSIDESLRLRREQVVGGKVESLADLIHQRVQSRLVATGCGLMISAIEIKAALPPHEVIEAFEAVQTAKIEQETLAEEVLGEQAQTILEAEAEADQLRAEAQGALQSRLATARSQAAHFQSDYELYTRFPLATIARLHRDTWQQVLAKSPQVHFVPDSDNGSVLRLPITRPEVKR